MMIFLKRFVYYGYDAANARTYKLSMLNQNQWVNGQPQPLNLQWQNAMFYPNTYLNFNANGEYTKHYYNGNERIASRIGENSVDICLNNTNSVQLCNAITEEHFRANVRQLIAADAPADMPPAMDIQAL